MYKPRQGNKEILDIAMGHINSVPYRCSLRWLFYRLLQDNIYTSKEDYSKWKSLCSKARKEYYGDWAPNTLEDDKRKIIYQNIGEESEEEALKVMYSDVVNYANVFLDHFYHQEETVIIMFESATMTPQFQYYAPDVDLIPFSGDPSIGLKWQASQKIKDIYYRYERPVTVLYFGDYDKKGLQIPESALNDIRKWAKCEIDFDRRGITPQQASDFNLTEKIGSKSGSYEWEALSDEQARQVIEESLSEYLDLGIINDIRNRETELSKEHQGKISELLKGK